MRSPAIVTRTLIGRSVCVDAVAVDPALAGVLAVGHGRDLGRHAPVGVRHDLLDVEAHLGRRRTPRVSSTSRRRPFSIEAELRQQVAVQQLAVAHVGEVQVEHVVAHRAGVDELQRRDLDALLPDVLRRRP